MISPKNSRNNQMVVFSGGVLFGFFVSSFLFLFSSTLDPSCPRSLAAHSDPKPFVSLPSSKDSSLLPLGPSIDKGWKSIHVFYGDSSHIADFSSIPETYLRSNQWFSQYRQDEIISKLLRRKRNGFFVDLASNDAIRISNTYSLETFFGWNGICLEPNPVYWGGLSYRKCHVAAAVVGNSTMDEVEFTFPKDKAPKGGIVGSNFDNKLTTESKEGMKRQFTVTLSDIFEKFQAPRIIDYLSLDVEGAEDLVMTSFPFSEYRFNILTVERPSESLSRILSSNGYTLLKTLKIGKETLWVHDSIKSTLDMSALEIDSQNYKYRENTGKRRIAPEESNKLAQQA